MVRGLRGRVGYAGWLGVWMGFYCGVYCEGIDV